MFFSPQKSQSPVEQLSRSPKHLTNSYTCLLQQTSSPLVTRQHQKGGGQTPIVFKMRRKYTSHIPSRHIETAERGLKKAILCLTRISCSLLLHENTSSACKFAEHFAIQSFMRLNSTSQRRIVREIGGGKTHPHGKDPEVPTERTR